MYKYDSIQQRSASMASRCLKPTVAAQRWPLAPQIFWAILRRHRAALRWDDARSNFWDFKTGTRLGDFWETSGRILGEFRETSGRILLFFLFDVWHFKTYRSNTVVVLQSEGICSEYLGMRFYAGTKDLVGLRLRKLLNIFRLPLIIFEWLVIVRNVKWWFVTQSVVGYQL